MNACTVTIPYQGIRTTSYSRNSKISGGMITHMIRGGCMHFDELVTDIRDLPANNAAKYLRKKGFYPVRGEKGTYELCHVSPKTTYQRFTIMNGLVTVTAESHPTGDSTLYEEIKKWSGGVIRKKTVHQRPNDSPRYALGAWA